MDPKIPPTSTLPRFAALWSVHWAQRPVGPLVGVSKPVDRLGMLLARLCGSLTRTCPERDCYYRVRSPLLLALLVSCGRWWIWVFFLQFCRVCSCLELVGAVVFVLGCWLSRRRRRLQAAAEEKQRRAEEKQRTWDGTAADGSGQNTGGAAMIGDHERPPRSRASTTDTTNLSTSNIVQSNDGSISIDRVID